MRVMIDLETLSTRKDAAIISIGLAAFDDEFVIETAHARIKMSEVFGHIDPATVKWWSEQGDAARHAAFSGEDTQTRAISIVRDFFDRHQPTEVWANSPSFDCVILRSWWDGQPRTPLGKYPISYRTERDVRTMLQYAKALKIPLPVWDGTAHNAMDDACNQARAIVTIEKELRRRSSL